CRGTTEAASIDYAGLVYPFLQKEMSLATPIPLQRLCRLAQVSRAGYYRWLEARPAVDHDLDLHDEIQRIALEFPSYGMPRITEELKRAVGKWARNGYAGSCGKTTCCACAAGSSW
ncbi:MAG TPA: hypothetical protein VH640_18100, partial [Bryobacteraceae bacterium]